eukprot:CAMPEP_0115347620 /NCGR_PEP_ID=MMETSP0270-20121206/94979_1 /TAXON_ID=71861 /ORGANISM="Scrippsiella trochoidea, Strain CCMP3099" /LENGTH=123 /DNA_ID=CAMNT_0002769557 /DNA_START=61 /DNA_END=432 /DNA_ORIENTATION=+
MPLPSRTRGDSPPMAPMLEKSCATHNFVLPSSTKNLPKLWEFTAQEDGNLTTRKLLYKAMRSGRCSPPSVAETTPRSAALAARLCPGGRSSREVLEDPTASPMLAEECEPPCVEGFDAWAMAN